MRDMTTSEKAADFTPAAFSPFSNYNSLITISDRRRTGGSPEHSLCGILRGNHDCRRDNGWSYWDRNACSCERPSGPYPIHHENPSALPFCPTSHLCDPIYRPSDPVSGHPGGPSDHPCDPCDPGPIPNPAPELWTNSIDQEQPQSLLQEPTRMHTS